MRSVGLFVTVAVFALAGCANDKGAADPSDAFPSRSAAEQAHDKCVATVAVAWQTEFENLRTETLSNPDNSIINGMAQTYGEQSPEFTTYYWALGQSAGVVRGSVTQRQVAEGIQARCR